MKKRLLFIFSILLFVFSVTAQKEANVWYFSEQLGLGFNSGEPQKLSSWFSTARNCSSISDSLGSFLFATNGELIMNKEFGYMQNGTELKGDRGASAGVLIVRKPSSSNIYYLFTVPRHQSNKGLYYSIIDMTLNNGLGAVTEEKNIPLNAAWDAIEKLTSLRHTNGNDIWIIARKDVEDSYASFLLTSEGLIDEPVISSTQPRPHAAIGSIKVSYDKKYLISADGTNGLGGQEHESFQLNKFDASTGVIEYMYSVAIKNDTESGNQNPNSVEFSPDSKLVYFGTWTNSTEYPGDSSEHRTFQLDMSLIDDPVEFAESAILISHNGGAGLQLATDGRIYCGRYEYFNINESPLNIIHHPGRRGLACNFEENAIDFGYDNKSIRYLPNILLDHLYRFEFEGHCSSEPFYFQSNFQPEPAFIEWNFADPMSGSNNISNEINPQHVFSGGAEYEVSVYVKYPNGRIEETSRIVTVTGTPNPDLGPDLLKCEDDQITLNAGNLQAFYTWSNGTFGENANQITVSDSGWYWVQVDNDGCIGYDTIYVGLFQKPEIIEDNLQLIPTACGGSTGKILGLTVSGEEPFSFEWFDADSNFISNTLDLQNLTVGNYYLHILDGNGCTTITEAYTIEDAGNITISLVEKQDEHCGQNSGTINITAASGSGGELLFSVDNGNSWQTGNPLFENLPAGNYYIRVKDLLGCESVYDNNPVVVENIAGPQVTNVTTTPENDYLQNGQIDLLATTSEGDVYFSIDGGNSFQLGDGLFQNLSAGSYTCVVKDNFGCDTSFTVEITRVISQLIEAIAGDGTTCIGNAVVVPIKLNKFSDIFKFHVKLTYDTAMLSCDGYINLNPVLANNIQVSIIPQADEVLVSWQGETPTTLEENALMLELVFGAKKQGISGIDWAATPGESAFYNQQLDLINTDYHFGSMRVYTRPSIFLESQKKLCEGDFYSAFPFVSDGSGEYTFEWTGPNGFYSNNQIVGFSTITQQQAGLYTFTVTDTIDCVESKSVNIIVSENPQIAFAGQDTIFASQGFILEAGSGFESYLWNTNDTIDAIQINEEGLYSVFVTTNQSCESSDSVRVYFERDLQTAFYLPNAFTPDGDGLNDEFKPVEKYDFVKTYQLSIYNRWGQLIFETSDIAQGWDGTYLGNPAEQGNYVYKIVFTAYPDFQNQQVVTGSVVVVR